MKESLLNLSRQEIRQINDAFVVEAVLRGDWEAFEIFVHKYEVALTLLAKRKLGSDDLAKEAVQETFMSAIRSLETYNSSYAFRTWLWSILINQCRQIGKRINRQNGLNRTPFFPESDIDLISREQDPESRACQRESAKQLEFFLQQLPDAQAEAIRLRFFEGLKYQEIADQMDSSLSAAKQRVAKGLQAIAVKMTNASASHSDITEQIKTHDKSG